MFGDPDVAFRGFSQLAWLRTLKNSARNWSLKRSVTSKFLRRPESKFQKFGPCTRLRPLPFCPGGGMQKNVCVPVRFTQLKCGSAAFVISPPVLYNTGPTTFGFEEVWRCPGSNGPTIKAELWCVLLAVSSPLLRV